MSPQFCWFLVQRSLEQSRDISVSMLLQVPCCGSAPEISVMMTVERAVVCHVPSLSSSRLCAATAIVSESFSLVELLIVMVAHLRSVSSMSSRH